MIAIEGKKVNVTWNVMLKYQRFEITNKTNELENNWYAEIEQI